MGNYKIVVPEATVNLVLNPRVANDTTGYAAIGGTISRQTVPTVQALRGSYALEVYPVADAYDGCYYDAIAFSSGQPYTFGLDIFGVLNVPYRMYFGDTGGTVRGTPTTFVGTGAWQRQWATWTCDVSTNYRLYVTKNNSASVGKFYLDGWQCENKAYATSYCDGAMTPYFGFTTSGCSWSGVAHASTSSRLATARMGGRVKDLQTDYYFKVQQALGLGAAPVEQVQSLHADPYQPGVLHEMTHETERLISLNGYLTGTSEANLFSRQASLITDTRPKFTRDDEPFWFQYIPGNKEIPVHYNGGLEGNEIQYRYEKCALRLVAEYPYWRTILG